MLRRLLCSSLGLCTCVATTLSRVCVFLLPLLLCSFEINCVRHERLQIVEISHNGIFLR
jgi:hypothetical protein